MYLSLGVGFGVATVVTFSHFAHHGEPPMKPWGFRSLSGPFEPERFTALGWSYAGRRPSIRESLEAASSRVSWRLGNAKRILVRPNSGRE